MKIAVVGCGAMGSVYASLLAQAGNEVLVVDRWQAHVDAINRHGLRLEGPGGDRTVPVRAMVDAPQEPVELVILAVKAADVARAAANALPLIGSGTCVLTIQNGIGSADTVAAVVGEDRLMVGVASAFGASLQGPGHARHNAMQMLRFGAFSTLAADRVTAVAQVWTAAGFAARAERDIAAIQWEKLICNAAYSAPCALTGMTVGAVMDDEYMGQVSRAAATEAWQVAKALGVKITVEDPIAHARAFGVQVFKAKPSALQDHEAGRASEIDIINGAVPRYGARVGVATPVNSTLVSLVKARERQWTR